METFRATAISLTIWSAPWGLYFITSPYSPVRAGNFDSRRFNSTDSGRIVKFL